MNTYSNRTVAKNFKSSKRTASSQTASGSSDVQPVHLELCAITNETQLKTTSMDWIPVTVRGAAAHLILQGPLEGIGQGGMKDRSIRSLTPGSNMDGPRDHHTKWSGSNKDKYDVTSCVESKIWYRWVYLQNRLSDIETNLFAKGERGRE